MNEERLLFENISDAEIETIKNVSAREEYDTNDLIFSEGDPADSFYVIEQGSVSIFIIESDKNKQLCKLSEGD